MMKKFFYVIAALAAAAMPACSLFDYDNYDAPSETLTGRVVDREGNPVLTDQGSEGIRVRLIETSWEGNVTPQDLYCKPDGTFSNTRLFEADYNITVDGPFVPVDNSVDRHIKGTEDVTFTVDPFLNVELLGASVSNGKITAKVRITRGISREELNAVLGPGGDYDDGCADITDVRLFVGYSPFMGYRNKDDRWSSRTDYVGAEFDASLGKLISVHSEGIVPSGRKVYVRAAARINYDTPRGSGTRRWNYSETTEVIIP